MVSELQHLKEAWTVKSRDLIGLTGQLLNEPRGKLAEGLRSLMGELGFEAGSRPLLSARTALEFFGAAQGDQFRNEMNIFFVTEQLTSLYKQRTLKASSNELIKVKKGRDRSNDGSCTGGSTHNNTSQLTDETSNQFGGDAHCNSVDEISQFDSNETPFGAAAPHFDFYSRSRLDNSEFESFIADAFDSLSADEAYLFTEDY